MEESYYYYLATTTIGLLQKIYLFCITAPVDNEAVYGMVTVSREREEKIDKVKITYKQYILYVYLQRCVFLYASYCEGAK